MEAYTDGVETGAEQAPLSETPFEIPPEELQLESTAMELEVQERGEELLAKLSLENIHTDIEVSERFGTATWEKIKAMGANTLQKLEVSGEKALGWIEDRGIPLPESKLGNAIAAGTLGIAGLAPGAGLLWGIAYTFAKRARAAGSNTAELDDLINNPAFAQATAS